MDKPQKLFHTGQKRSDGRSRRLRFTFETEPMKQSLLDKAMDLSKHIFN